MVGAAIMVTVAVFVQPLLLVYVITLVPVETPITTPERLTTSFTVATAGVADAHVKEGAGVPLPVNVVVDPTQVVADTGETSGLTTQVIFRVTLQPPLFLYVITLVPVATPVTKPVLLIVATAVLDDVQGVVASAVPEPVNCLVPLRQTVGVPVIVGKATMVTVDVALHPLLLV